MQNLKKFWILAIPLFTLSLLFLLSACGQMGEKSNPSAPNIRSDVSSASNAEGVSDSATPGSEQEALKPNGDRTVRVEGVDVSPANTAQHSREHDGLWRRGERSGAGNLRVVEIFDTGGRDRFRVTVRSDDPRIVGSLHPEQWRIVVEYADPSETNVSPVWMPPQNPERQGASEAIAEPVGERVFVEVQYLGTLDNHRRISSVTVLPTASFTTQPLLSTDAVGSVQYCASICYVYTYVLYEVKSVVVRANPCGGGTAYFYHRHCIACDTHLLLTSSFTSCTYAYDCYPGHSINQVTVCGYVPTGGPAWSVTFYVYNCNGRC